MFHSIRFAWPVLMLGLLLSAGAAMADGAATISTATSDEYGTYLVTGDGMSVYLFEADTRGSGESSCYGKCADPYWPPVLTSGAPQADGQARGNMLGTIKRKDGAMQVTYGGWPLYLFVKDKAPGDTAGQDVHGFDGEWYLVTPEGTAVHAEEEEDDHVGGY